MTLNTNHTQDLQSFNWVFLTTAMDNSMDGTESPPQWRGQIYNVCSRSFSDYTSCLFKIM